ncbi:hypothetical protein [Streptomyces montanisoli]|uniref:Uncharacterized protein n=1 Tax=Streptomyces montanisoli TaxID=2798581 RepID=A0A940MIK5_9ACTN|nr:hypothetical protein [Streptomyces montanisoli]MBP0459931.1 hypothetical protein [Streptomyces montanisoli]
MSEPGKTWVNGPRGSVHAGNGDIHNYITVGAELKEAGESAFRRIADDELAWKRRVLVAPPGMGEARHVLAGTGTVILDGAPGSGRTSAAHVLLSEHHRDVGIFRELLPGEEDEQSLRNPGLVGAGDRLLLDLSAAEFGLWAAARADLSSLRKAVHEQRAHLVVVMPHGSAIDSDLQRYRVEIECPPALEVFRRHLRALGVPFKQYLRSDPTVTDLLERRPPMREIAAFADLVRRARGAARTGDGFAEWCKAARATRGDRSGKIAEFVTGVREGPQRALLITVAMLHGAHADVINWAAERLLRTLKHPPDEVPLLQRKDLAERLKEICAGTGPDGHVHFRDLDYDAAIRAHFWDHMPELRQYLGTWTARSVDSNDPHVTQDLRDTLVARLASQYLRTGRGDGLASLAEGWSATPTSRNRLEAAVHLLACGLNDPIEGAGFRERVYQWCANKRLKGEFAQVLVQVCADVIAASHPDRALFRLYHLARRERGTTRALQALCGLVATSGRLRRLLLDVLARHSLSPAELGIFLQAADPEALIEPFGNSRALVEERSTQHSAITCWQAVLAGLPPATWQQYAERWLSTATGAGHRGDLLLDLIVSAADRCADKRGATFAALYACARSAERTAPAGAAQSDTTERLLRKISTAQRLGPRTTPSPTASSKGSAP